MHTFLLPARSEFFFPTLMGSLRAMAAKVRQSCAGSVDVSFSSVAQEVLAAQGSILRRGRQGRLGGHKAQPSV